MEKGLIGGMKRQYPIILAGFLGALAFVCVYGVQVLDVTYVDWIKNAGGDLAQSYYGWRFFRNSDWHFPFGLMDSVAYPSLTSIIYIDSVPLFNLFFKSIRWLLPSTFQFFGLWGLTCFVLSGVIGAAVIRTLTKSDWYAVLGSEFFILCPVVVQRLYTHTALAANWLILLCIFIIIRQCQKPVSPAKSFAVWAGLFALAVGINIYYLPILGIFMFAFCVYQWIKSKKVFCSIGILVSSLLGTFVTFYLLGGMHGLSMSDAAPDSMGYLGANLNSLFNAMETDRYLSGYALLGPNFPLATDGQYEGYAYLGMGLIICLVAVMVVLIMNKAVRQWIWDHKLEFWIIVIGSFALIILSTATLVTWNQHTLFRIWYPEFIMKVYSVFRSSGRFMWGVWNLLGVLLLWLLWKGSKVRQVAALLAVCLLVQVVDLSPYLYGRHKIYFSKQQTYTSLIMQQDWTDVLENKNQFIFLNNRSFPLPVFYDFAELALQNGMTINDFYYSRRNNEEIDAYKEQQLSQLEQGNGLETAVYVFDSFWDAKGLIGKLNLYYIANQIIGTTTSLEQQHTLQMEDVTDQIQELTSDTKEYTAKESGLYVLEVRGNNAVETTLSIQGQQSPAMQKDCDGDDGARSVFRMNEGDCLQITPQLGADQVRLAYLGQG